MLYVFVDLCDWEMIEEHERFSERKLQVCQQHPSLTEY